MTKHEFREIINQLGLSQLAAARLLDTDGRTVRRYISGDTRIPGGTAKLLRLLAARPELLPVVKEMAA